MKPCGSSLTTAEGTNEPEAIDQAQHALTVKQVRQIAGF
jgi:hypothetical protein